MRSRFLSVFVAALVLSTAQADGALFLGNTVRMTYEGPNLGTVAYGPFDAVVTDPGIEAQFLAAALNVDLFDDSIRMSVPVGTGISFGVVAFNGVVIHDILGSLPAFSSVTVDPTSTMAAVVTFDANSIFVNFSDTFTGHAGAFLFLNVSAAAAAIIPEPATASLGMLGVAGLMLRRRRVV